MRTWPGYCRKLPYSSKEGTYYGHFFPSAYNVTMCDGKDPRPIYKIEIYQWLDAPEDAYWSWWNKEKEDFQWLYASKVLLEMCFPGGFAPEIKAGRGQPLQVHIREMGEFTVAECKAADWKP